MKKPIIFATALGLIALGSNAYADHHASPTALGAGAAHLAAAHDSAAQAADIFVLRQDPSGASMCFDLAGSKAPLSACGSQADADAAAPEHILAFDPSGAPMCFDLAGSKAPLSACGPTHEVKKPAHAPQLAFR